LKYYQQCYVSEQKKLSHHNEKEFFI